MNECIGTTEPQQMKKLTVFRKIVEHQESPANELLEILVLDEPGPGGAHHTYLLYWPNSHGQLASTQVRFQNGPIPENGVNGVTQEALLAIVADRLRCFQAGPFANTYNQAALEYVEKALGELKARTRERRMRGVEGKMEK
jgi:hypothetical protein